MLNLLIQVDFVPVKASFQLACQCQLQHLSSSTVDKLTTSMCADFRERVPIIILYEESDKEAAK